MKDIAEDIIETDYDGLRDALSKIQYDTKTGLIVHYNDTKYEFLLNIKKDVDELLCLSSSVLKVDDLEKFHKKPLFHRLSWKFRQSTILFNDPTRYIDVDDDFTKDLQGGWSVGTYDDYFLRNIADMIVKISDFFNFSHDNILFYGSSMGGFTSLMLGTMIRDSMVMADLPQLYLLNFGHFTNKVLGKHYSKYSEEELSKVNYRFSFMELMKKENYVPDAQIFISCRPYDIDTQYLQFIGDLYNIFQINDNENNIKLVIRPIDNHQHMDKKDSIDYVNRRFDEKKMGKIKKEFQKTRKHNRNLRTKLNEKDLEIEYYSSLSSFNRLFRGFNSKAYIVFKSISSHESIGDNLRLYNLLNSDIFDLGYYLKNKNLKNTKFCSVLHPVVHYIFFGINENAIINRNLKFESNNKAELIKLLSGIKK